MNACEIFQLILCSFSCLPTGSF